MKIETGRGTIPLITLVGIWSISALSALPGLAVSPILGQMSAIFPHASEFDIQLLSSLPSLLTIPFILLSGKLTERVNNIALLQAGLVIFALSGVLYLFSTQMWQLIAVSALLGIGAGIIVPLSTGLISRHFEGRYRTQQFGLSSAITNVTLVLATMLTGYLAEVNWHLPFVVYLVPVLSLLLSFSLKRDSVSSKPVVEADAGRIDKRRLVGLMAFYGLITYLVIIVSFNLPFLMKEYHFDTGASGIIISLFFLAIMLPGFFLNPVLSFLGSLTKFTSLSCIAVGMLLILMSGNEWVLGGGAVLIGLGYGVMQPVIYDQTTRVADTSKVTFALALVMAMNYLAILLCPVIIDTLQSLFHIHTQRFAFGFNLGITLLAVVWSYWKRHDFLFEDAPARPSQK
ncbi:MAG TPA: MFS transporter [Candidatus Barnesiella excrementigallinarum]|nr:MFS transporter [Candidatus Barnesiella excrementigallinarum]